MTPQPADIYYVANPDMVSAAIRGLIKAVFIVGGGLGSAVIGLLIYIYNIHKKEWEELRGEMTKLTTHLGVLADRFLTEISSHEHRITVTEDKIESQERICDDRHSKTGKAPNEQDRPKYG